jgi:hypothetical protein
MYDVPQCKLGILACDSLLHSSINDKSSGKLGWGLGSAMHYEFVLFKHETLKFDIGYVSQITDHKPMPM